MPRTTKERPRAPRRTIPSGLVLLATGCAAAPAKTQEVQLPAPAVAAHSTPSPREAPSGRAGCGDGEDISASFQRLSWRGAYDVVRGASSSWADEDAPSTDAEAKAAVCVTSSGSSGEPPERARCEGAFWIISTDHHFFTDLTYVLVPVGDAVFVFDAGLIGGGLCSGQQSSTLTSLDVRPEGSALRLRIERERHTWHEGAPAERACQPEGTEITEVRFEAASGRACSIGPRRPPTR